MIRIGLLATLIAAPALADTLPKSEAATAFIQHCLTDVSDHRIATLKRQVPEYAASLSDEDLLAGAMGKASKTCPCFLQIVAIEPTAEETDVEAKVARFVEYLDLRHQGEAAVTPPVVARLTRMCGKRASILPPLWVSE